MKTIYHKCLLRDKGVVFFSPNLDINSVDVHVFEDQGKIYVEGIITFNKEGSMLELPEDATEPFNVVLLAYCPVCNKSYKAELLDVMMVDLIEENNIIKQNYVAKSWMPWEEYTLGCTCFCADS